MMTESIALPIHRCGTESIKACEPLFIAALELMVTRGNKGMEIRRKHASCLPQSNTSRIRILKERGGM